MYAVPAPPDYFWLCPIPFVIEYPNQPDHFSLYVRFNRTTQNLVAPALNSARAKPLVPIGSRYPTSNYMVVHFDMIPQKNGAKTHITIYGHMFDCTPILGGTGYHIKMHYHIIGNRVLGTYWYERFSSSTIGS